MQTNNPFVSGWWNEIFVGFHKEGDSLLINQVLVASITIFSNRIEFVWIENLQFLIYY